MQKKLDASIKHRQKVEKERSQQDAKLRKLKEQHALSDRLLSEDERNLLLRRKYTQALDEDELNRINKKLQDDKKEQIRRKKLANRRGNVSKKKDKLNDFIGNVTVEKSGRTTRNAQIQVYNIKVGNLRKLEFEFFFEVASEAN